MGLAINAIVEPRKCMLMYLVLYRLKLALLITDAWILVVEEAVGPVTQGVDSSFGLL